MEPEGNAVSQPEPERALAEFPCRAAYHTLGAKRPRSVEVDLLWVLDWE